MKTYKEIKAEHQKAYNDLITKHKAFFAFSDSQFDEAMARLGENITTKDIMQGPAGMFILKSEVKAFMDGIKQSNDDYDKAIRESKEAKEEAIRYELSNHECYYTGDIAPVVEIFDGVYSKADIVKVYNKFKNLSQ